MCLSVFLVVVDNTIVNVALPSISGSLGASNSALQWIVDGYSLPFAGLLLAGGGTADRLGRKRMMLIGLVGFAAFSAGAAFAHSVPTLLAARALMGAAAAFVFPATLSILTVTFVDPRERAKAFGVWGATSGLAVAVGPVVGGALISHFWFGSIFLVNVPIAALTIAAAAWLVPESRSPERRRFDLAGLALGTAAVSTLVLAIIQGPSWGWSAPGTLALGATAIALLVGFSRYELTRSEPLLDVRIFRIPAFSAGAGAIATTFFGLFGFIFLMTQYFQLVRGYSALSAGVHTLPFAAVSMLVTPLGALAALRLGARWVVSAGLAVMGVALAWVGLLSGTAAYVGPVVGSMVLLAFGFSLITAPSTAAVMGSLAPSQIGAGAAVNNTTRELGGTLGVAVLGSVFSSHFAPAVAEALAPAHLAAARLTLAQSSMQAAIDTVHALPSAASAALGPRVADAFLGAFHRGCFVGAVVMVAAAAATWHFLAPGVAPGGEVPELAPRAH
jgi:EmrB/QacA subfamily drug resistance transporter